MRQLTIYRYYFTNTDCYKKNIKMIPQGVQVHSTGAANPYLKRYVGPDDGRLGKNVNNNHHNKPGKTVCASAYIGRLADGTPAIYQALPWEERCWLSGSGVNGNANKMGYVGFEICEDKKTDKEYFDAVVMGLSVNLTAYFCQEYNIPLSNVKDHRELHGLGLASNHGDITHWLRNFGLNMNDYRRAVQQALDEGINVTYIDANTGEIINKQNNIDVGSTLNEASQILSQMSNTIDAAIKKIDNIE